MNINDLKDALNIVKPALNPNGMNTASEYIYFSGEKVMISDQSMCIQTDLETSFDAWIKGKDLINIVSKIKNNKIKFSKKDNNINLQTKTSNINFKLEEVIDDYNTYINSIVDESTSDDYTNIPDDFLENILVASKYCLSDDFDSSLACVGVKDGIISAMDKKQAFTTTSKIEVDDMLLMCTTVKKIVEIKPTKYFISENWYHFKNDISVISIRKTDGELPSLQKITSFTGQKFNIYASILDDITLTASFTDHFLTFIKVKLRDNKIQLSINAESGTIKTQAKINYSDDELIFKINPEYFANLVENCTDFEINEDSTLLKGVSDTAIIVAALFNTQETETYE